MTNNGARIFRTFSEDMPEAELPSTEDDWLGTFPITNRGIQIWLFLRPIPDTDDTDSVFKAWLPCRSDPCDPPATIHLCLRESNYYRQALFSYGRGSYNSREGNTTFAVSCSSFVVEKITKESCRLRTRERAVYNWPCANGSMRRSRAVLADVRPWQPLKVVAYARRRGNCRRCTVQSLPAGLKSNEIRGMQCVWLLCSKRTSMKRRCRAEI